MDIDQVNERKEKLEQDIGYLVSDFMRDTDCNVVDITIDSVERQHSKPKYAVMFVGTTVEL